MVRAEAPSVTRSEPLAENPLGSVKYGWRVELLPEGFKGCQWGTFGLLHLLDAGRERVGFHHSREKRRPRAVLNADGLRFDQPDSDPTFEVKLSKFVEILGEGTELVSMLFGDDDQAPRSTCDGVGEAPGEVIVVCSAELVLDDELGAILTLCNDVNAAPAGRLYLRPTYLGEVDSDCGTDCVHLFRKQRREVRRLALPCFG